eukprot:g2323.t1
MDKNSVCQGRLRDACKSLSACDVAELRAAAVKASADSEKLRAELAKSRALNNVLRESRQKATRAMVPVIRERNQEHISRIDAEKLVRSLRSRVEDLDGVARKAVLDKVVAQKQLAEHKHSMTALHEAKDQAEKRAKAQAQAHAKVKTEADVQAHAQKLVHAQMQAAQILRRAVLRRRQRSKHACECAIRVAYRAAHAAIVAASNAAESAVKSRAQSLSMQQEALLRAELASATAELTAAAVRSKEEATRVATFSRKAEAEAQRREHAAAAAVRLEMQERCDALRKERDELRKKIKCEERKHDENILDQKAQIEMELRNEHRAALDQKQQECDEALEALIEAKREQNLANIAELEKKHCTELQKLSENSRVQLKKAHSMAARQERELREQLVKCRKEHDTAFNVVVAREAATVRELTDARLAWDSKLAKACTKAAEAAMLEERTTLQAAHEVALVQARRKEREVVLAQQRAAHETQVVTLREEHIAELQKMTNSKGIAFAAEVQQLQASHEHEVAVLKSRVAELERELNEQNIASKAALTDHEKQLAEERRARRKADIDIEQYKTQSAETAKAVALHETLAGEYEAKMAALKDKCARLEHSLREQREDGAARAKEHARALAAVEHERDDVRAKLQKSTKDRQLDIAAAQAVAAAAAKQKLQVEQLHKTNAELEARCTAAQKAADERGGVMLRQKDSEISDLKSANDQCRDDLLQTCNELQNLKQINADMLHKESEHNGAIVRLQRDYTEQLAVLQHQLELEESMRREIHEKMMELRGTIRVFCRVRPLLPHESSCVGSECVRAEQHAEGGEKQAVALHSVDGSGRDCTKTFSFDRVFMQSEGRHHVHDEIKELVRSVCDGKHVCIFAYGQTGSGKTYTMDELSEFAVLELERMQVKRSKRSASTAVAMEASMLEVYNENVVSLLPPCADGHSDAVSAIAAQTWQRVESAMPLQAAIAAAKSRRASRSHKLNKCSSRSHCLLWLRLVDPKGHANGGSLLLADLAGSERVAKSGVLDNKAALLEATCINKSLSALADTEAAREKEPIEQLAAVVGETVNLGELLTAPDVAKKLEALDQTAKSKTVHVERCVVDLAEALARNAARVRSSGRADVDHTLQTKLTHELIPILRSVKAQADD